MYFWCFTPIYTPFSRSFAINTPRKAGGFILLSAESKIALAVRSDIALSAVSRRKAVPVEKTRLPLPITATAEHFAKRSAVRHLFAAYLVSVYHHSRHDAGLEMVCELAVCRNEIAVTAAGKAQTPHAVAAFAAGGVEYRRSRHRQFIHKCAAEHVIEKHQPPCGDAQQHPDLAAGLGAGKIALLCAAVVRRLPRHIHDSGAYQFLVIPQLGLSVCNKRPVK